MTFAVYSAKRNRVFVRRFDYDDATRRHEAGEKIADLAREYGVSTAAVYRAVNPVQRARMDVRSAAFVMTGECVDCGGKCARYRTGEGTDPRCHTCAGKKKATSVRENELRCSTCREWKRDAAFPRGKGSPLRRGRHQTCSVCHTAIKRAYREARRQPCSHGCGTLVDTVDRRNRDKPLECASCASRRVHAERKAVAA